MSQSTFGELVPRPDLSEVDWDSLSSWGLRVGMASLGWVSQVHLMRQKDGMACVRVELNHGAWHGCLASVKLWETVPGLTFNSADTTECAREIRKCLVDVSREARRAWDTCTDCVPRRGLRLGELVVDDFDTNYLRNYPHPGVVVPERSRPTESLPGWPGQPTLDAFLDAPRVDGEAWLETAIKVASFDGLANVRWADRLHPWFQRDPWAYTDRQWTYAGMCRINRWNGTLINTSLSKGALDISTHNITPLGAEAVATATLATLRTMERTYGADGILPPGLHEYVLPKFDIDSEAYIEAWKHVPVTP